MQPIGQPPTQPPTGPPGPAPTPATPATEHRDRGLSRVRKLTVWLGGGALVATGLFAAWVGRPQPSAADSKSTTSPDTVPVTPRATIPPQSGSQSTTPSTSRSQTPVAPPQQAPRQSRTRPRAGSGGS